MIHLEVGDRIHFSRSKRHPGRFPYRRRHTQAWNRNRRRQPENHKRLPPSPKGFYVVKSIVNETQVVLA